jgi:hypothetical protein
VRRPRELPARRGARRRVRRFHRLPSARRRGAPRHLGRRLRGLLRARPPIHQDQNVHTRARRRRLTSEAVRRDDEGVTGSPAARPCSGR